MGESDDAQKSTCEQELLAAKPTLSEEAWGTTDSKRAAKALSAYGVVSEHFDRDSQIPSDLKPEVKELACLMLRADSGEIGNFVRTYAAKADQLEKIVVNTNRTLGNYGLVSGFSSRQGEVEVDLVITSKTYSRSNEYQAGTRKWRFGDNEVVIAINLSETNEHFVPFLKHGDFVFDNVSPHVDRALREMAAAPINLLNSEKQQ